MNSSPGSGPGNSWVIDADNEQELTDHDTEVFEVSQRMWQLRQGPAPRAVIDLDDEDDIVELENQIEKEIFDLTRDDDVAVPGPHVRRNPEIASLGHRLLKVTWKGMALKEGTVAQIEFLPQHALRFRYLRITAIYRPTGSQHVRDTMIRGIPYIKSMHLGGLLKWRRREVAAVYDVDRDDPREPEAQALVEVRITDLTALATLVTTNAPYPEHSEDGVLVCRWKYVRYWPSGKYREAGRTTMHPDYEAAMVYITPEEADGPFRVSREALRRDWRGGPPALGGSYQPYGSGGGSPATPIELDGPTRRPSRPAVQVPGQKYTFFDSFSGAGGASRGAVRAGLEPIFAVDHWEPACNSYRRNFPGADLFEMNVSDFVTWVADIRADILHLSPPCQVFSPAHTIPSEAKDAANLASLFACEVVLRKVKPRVFTLEQTFGLMMARFSPYFNHLISTFTTHGYSVRWSVVPLANWGLPALRKRLIMIGAGPGEKLPPFPKPSHSATGGENRDGGGPRPYVTAREAIARVRARRGVDPLHAPRAMRRLRYPPWDADKILPRCITTSGGQNYHFSGTRDLTLRELATLQGFPVYHAFEAPYVKKQIGNAFPPVVAEHLFRHIRQWLLEEDGVVRGEAGVAAPVDGLVIEDEDDDVVVEAVVVEDNSEDEGIAWLFEDGEGILGDGGVRDVHMADGFVEIRDDGGTGGPALPVEDRDVVLVDGQHDIYMADGFVEVNGDAGDVMDLDGDSDGSDWTLGRPRRGEVYEVFVHVVD